MFSHTVSFPKTIYSLSLLWELQLFLRWNEQPRFFFPCSVTFGKFLHRSLFGSPTLCYFHRAKQRLLTCWEPDIDFTRCKRYWKWPFMSHHQWSHWPRKPKFHQTTDGEEITTKGIRFVCIIGVERKPYPYPLTCLTLFFELPTLNIPTVWRPASETHHSTILLFNFSWELYWTKAFWPMCVLERIFLEKQHISPQICTYHVNARLGSD